jgi:hypothetical protein
MASIPGTPQYAAAQKEKATPVRDQKLWEQGAQRWAQYIDQKYNAPAYYTRPGQKTLLGE